MELKLKLVSTSPVAGLVLGGCTKTKLMLISTKTEVEVELGKNAFRLLMFASSLLGVDPRAYSRFAIV